MEFNHYYTADHAKTAAMALDVRTLAANAEAEGRDSLTTSLCDDRSPRTGPDAVLWAPATFVVL